MNGVNHMVTRQCFAPPAPAAAIFAILQSQNEEPVQIPFKILLCRFAVDSFGERWPFCAGLVPASQNETGHDCLCGRELATNALWLCQFFCFQ